MECVMGRTITNFGLAGFLLFTFLMTCSVIAADDQTALIDRCLNMLDGDSIGSNTARMKLIEIGSPAVEPLINFIMDPKQVGRDEAMLALAGIGDLRAVPVLINALNNENQMMRETAAEGLCFFKDPRAVEPILALIRSEDDQFRRRLMQALVKIADPRSLQPAIEALQDKDRHVRRSAVQVLRALKDPVAIDPLYALALDLETDVRLAVALALDACGDPRAVSLLIVEYENLKAFGTNIYDDDFEEIKLALWRHGPAITDKLLAILAKRPEHYTVARVVAGIDDPQLSERLIGLLKDDEQREGVSLVLRIRRDLEVIPLLLTALHNPDPAVRTAVVQILASYQETKLADIFMGLARDDDGGVRLVVLEALARDDNELPVDILLYALNDPARTVRQLAIKSVLKHPIAVAREPLATLLTDQDTEISWLSAQALVKLADNRALPILTTMAKSTDLEQQVTAFAALFTIATINELPMLTTAMQSECVELRREATTVMGNIGDNEAVTVLLAALKDTDPWVRENAVKSLSRYDDPRVLPALLEFLKAGDPDALNYPWNPGLPVPYTMRATAEALAKIGQPSVEPLLGLLTTGSPETGAYAAYALALLNEQRALPWILTCLRNLPPVLEFIFRSGMELPDEEIEQHNKKVIQKESQLEILCMALRAFHDPRPVEPLLAVFNSTTDSRVKMNIGLLLAEIGDARVIPVLDHAVREDVTLISLASKVFEHIEDPRADELLSSYLKHPDLKLRMQIISWMDRHKDPRVVEPLIELACCDDVEIRKEALQCLLSIEGLQTADIFLPLLHDPQPGIRQIARWGVAANKDTRAIDMLIAELATAEDYLTRMKISITLEDITGRHYGENASRWQRWREKQQKAQ